MTASRDEFDGALEAALAHTRTWLDQLPSRRVQAAAASDLVVAFYNPRSLRRTWQLERALEILREHRPVDCPAAVATDVGRPGQELVRTTLAELDPTDVGMLSLVLVGSSTTQWIGGRMVTRRGYGTGDDGQP
jgi:cobalt-precorrin 5A hydrolase / precorrin-3B C17-methyltransferase